MSKITQKCLLKMFQKKMLMLVRILEKLSEKQLKDQNWFPPYLQLQKRTVGRGLLSELYASHTWFKYKTFQSFVKEGPVSHAAIMTR